MFKIQIKVSASLYAQRNYIIYMITLILFSYQNLIKYNCQNIHYSEFAQQIEIPTRSKFKTVKVN